MLLQVHKDLYPSLGQQESGKQKQKTKKKKQKIETKTKQTERERGASPQNTGSSEDLYNLVKKDSTYLYIKILNQILVVRK